MRVEDEKKVYYCGLCNRRYALEGDCLLCEDACRMLRALSEAFPTLEEPITDLDKGERFRLSRTIMEIAERTMLVRDARVAIEGVNKPT
jgi:hypothetical protein